MGELERLLIRIEADTTLLRRELARADSAVGNFASSVDGRFRGVENRFASVGATFGRAFGAYAIYQTIKSTGELADQYTLMSNRLATVTKSAEELNYVQEKLQRTAFETRSPIRDLTEFYSRMSFALKNAGVSTNEVLEFTGNLSKAVAISGATTAEAAGALRQLSQGVGSSVLRGQELVSVMEQMPIVADLIARKMGVTTGELLKLGEAGKITGETVFKAIIEASDELDSKLGKTVPTMAQSWTQLSNRIVEFIGIANQSTGASAGVTDALQTMADKLAAINKELKEGTAAWFEWGDAGSVGPGRSAKTNIDRRASGEDTLLSAIGGRDPIGGGFDPDAKGEKRGPKQNDPWNTTNIPVSPEEQLAEFKAAYAETHEAAMTMLQDLIDTPTETVADKMNAITEAVKRGEIGWREYGDMQKQISQQAEGELDGLLSATSSALTSIFNESKTAAIAATLINTYQGISKALATMAPPYSYAQAAITAAMGFAQVSRIRSTSKSSTGGASGVGGGGGAGAGGGAAAGPAQTLFVQGLNTDSIFTGEAVRGIAQKLIDFQRDGGKVLLGAT